MRIKIKTSVGVYTINLPESNVYEFCLNEYSEEIVECFK